MLNSKCCVSHCEGGRSPVAVCNRMPHGSHPRWSSLLQAKTMAAAWCGASTFHSFDLFLIFFVLLKIWSSSGCGRCVSLCNQLVGWNTGSAKSQSLYLLPTYILLLGLKEQGGCRGWFQNQELCQRDFLLGVWLFCLQSASTQCNPCRKMSFLSSHEQDIIRVLADSCGGEV